MLGAEETRTSARTEQAAAEEAYEQSRTAYKKILAETTQD